MTKMVAIVHSPEYANWCFSADHPTQGRRFINGFNAIAKDHSVLKPRLATRQELLRVHSDDYVREVLDEHICSEWNGPREDLSHLATLFAGGTLVALDALLDKSADIAIHLPGAKHHAQLDRSSGFCVFNDFAIAADVATKDHGLKVAIFDIDAHHGDGVENLTRSNPNIMTFSIHEAGIFPGTGMADSVEERVFNQPLNQKTGKGDLALLEGTRRFISVAKEFAPDLIFLTSGADGLQEDPLTNLKYTIPGYAAAGKTLADAFAQTPILMGGAGGYLPDDGTPDVWAAVAGNLSDYVVGF